MNKFILTLLLLPAVIFAIAGVSEALTMDAYSITSDPMYPGEKDVYLRVTLINTQKGSVEDVNMQLAFGNTFEAIQDKYAIAKIGPSERYTAVFKFNVRENIDPGAYENTLKVTYKDAGGSNYKSFVTTIPFEVATLQRLSINNLKNTLEPGIFDSISFNLKNEGQLSISDIYIFLDTDFDFATPIDKIYIPQITAGSTVPVEFKVFADRTEIAGVHPMNITIDSAQMVVSQQVGLLIAGVPKLKTAGVSTDNTVYLGKEFSLSVQIEDIGAGDARSVVAQIISPGIFGNTKSFVGTIDSDDTESAVFDITTFNIGMNEIKVNVTYLDDQYREYSQILPATFDAKFDFSPIISLIVLVCLGYGGYYFLRHRKEIIARIRKLI